MNLSQAILAQLSRGKQNAITGRELAHRLGHRDTRKIRLEINQMRKDGHLIGLSVTKPSGYFLIETREELEHCMSILKGYCVEAALARRDLKLAGRKLLDPYQMSLI